MAFTFKVTESFQMIGGKTITGTYTNTGGSTGGSISLPVQALYHLSLQPQGTAVLANQPVVNATLPLRGKYNVSAPVVNTANEVGTFIAIGV
jgi:hypothetical protein